MRNYVVVLVLSALLGACASPSIPPADEAMPANANKQAHAITPADVSAPQTWGDSDNVTKIRHLYFSEQPDAEALRIAKTNGVTTVINLRAPGESDWDEAAAAKKLGLNYVNIPIRKESATFDSSAIAAINAAVRDQEGSPVLLHCSSGNRAAAWLAIHLIEAHKLSGEDAIAVAQKAGLTSDDMVQRVETYLD